MRQVPLRNLDRSEAAQEKERLQNALRAAQAERAQLAARLKQREEDLARQAGELARAEREAQRYRAELASLPGVIHKAALWRRRELFLIPGPSRSG